VKIEVTSEEAYPLKRLRTGTDAGLIEGVLLRGLGITREKYESEAANEETRKEIFVYKRVLDLLFTDELIKERIV